MLVAAVVVHFLPGYLLLEEVAAVALHLADSEVQSMKAIPYLLAVVVGLVAVAAH